LAERAYLSPVRWGKMEATLQPAGRIGGNRFSMAEQSPMAMGLIVATNSLREQGVTIGAETIRAMSSPERDLQTMIRKYSGNRSLRRSQMPRQGAARY
jgi:hypothetical protein